MKRILIFVPMLLLLAGLAAAQDVRMNYDKTADFSKYKTYKWVEIKGSDKDAMIDGQIKSAIDAQLATKGFKLVDSDNADIYVGYQTAITTEKQVNTFSSDFGYGPGWGYYRGYGGMGSSTSTSTTSTLYVGALQIDFYDVATKKPVFRTIGTKTIDQKAKPDKRQKNLTKAITKMLKDYPPTPKA
jgi:opacity protein-like surface antigen